MEQDTSVLHIIICCFLTKIQYFVSACAISTGFAGFRETFQFQN